VEVNAGRCRPFEVTIVSLATVKRPALRDRDGRARFERRTRLKPLKAAKKICTNLVRRIGMMSAPMCTIIGQLFAPTRSYAIKENMILNCGAEL